jgi:iron complex outermembrane receptor protein
MAGANYSIISQRNYNPITRGFSSSYTKKKVTPTVSFIYKPIKAATAYISYIQALERGSSVGPTYKNAGDALDPLVSDQYEVGAKAEIYDLFAGISLFYIQKPNQYSDNGTLEGTWVQDGRQAHRGAEFTVEGRLFDRVNILAGGTYFNAEIERSNRKELEGKQPPYTPRLLGQVYLEYDTPIEDFTVTGGVFYTGESYANDLNTNKLPAYATADIGLRYILRTSEYVDFKFILNVSNLNNVKYWAGQTIGSTRAVSFSISAIY